MKAVIKADNRKEIIKIIDFLLDEGYDDFIIFASVDNKEKHILENQLFVCDIKAVVISAIESHSTYDLLRTVKGSLSDTFLLAYSYEISSFDLEDALCYHKSSTKISTLLSTDKKTVGIILETEVFDYMIEPNHFEKSVIRRIFEDDEASIYNLSSYELF